MYQSDGGPQVTPAPYPVRPTVRSRSADGPGAGADASVGHRPHPPTARRPSGASGRHDPEESIDARPPARPAHPGHRGPGAVRASVLTADTLSPMDTTTDPSAAPVTAIGRPVRFGIVTPTLNAERYLADTLRSIWSQASDEVTIDHVLVDGGSTDGTTRVAEDFRTRVVVATDDQGMYDAVNRGLSLVEGDIVGYLNADDELAPGALAAVGKAFAEHPEARWLMGKREFIDGDGTAFAWMQPVPFSLRSYLGLGWSCVPQETVWMRRDLYDEVGPFDTTFRNTGDYDMYARCRHLSEPLILRRTLGRFRLHGDQLSFKPEVMARESRRVQEKNGTVDRSGWVRGKLLSLRLNARNPRWLLAKKTGRIRFVPEA
jgi:glycosyltransferase involved in cell wall biosynthesis